MNLFGKKYATLFISKHFVDPGYVTVGKTAGFEGLDAWAYTEETLGDVLKKIEKLFPRSVRVVLGEELVYVTGFSFLKGTPLSRELVRQSVEEVIPEDLQKTAWDFKALYYVKTKETETEILVQAAVMEEKFFKVLSRALAQTSLVIENILPESYALACLVKDCEGVSLIVARDRENVLLVAAERGFVITARVARPEAMLEEVEKFIAFVSARQNKPIARFILSRLDEAEVAGLQQFKSRGYELIEKDCNPLVGGALEEPVAGADERVLNLNVFLQDKKPFYF